MNTDIPSPESVGTNHNHVIRPILNRERSAGNQQQRFIVQAFSNLDGWQDTRYRADNEDDAKQLATWLLTQNARWMDGKPTQTRVRDRYDAYRKAGEILHPIHYGGNSQ